MALTAFSSMVQANSRDGFYVGAGIGMSADNYDLTTTNLATGLWIQNNADNTNVLGDIFGGFGYTTASAYFIGGEIGTYFPSRSITVANRPDLTFPHVGVNDTLTIQDYITFDLLPGYAISQNILVYGRVGASYAGLELNQPMTTPVPGFNNNENKWGGRVGVGANYAFNNQFGVGIDYIYTSYQDTLYTSPFNTSFKANASSNFLGISILYTI